MHEYNSHAGGAYNRTMETRRREIEAARLHEIYSRTAAFYDAVVAEHQAAAKDIALAMLARRPGEHFLEVGVGTAWCFSRIVAGTGSGRAIGLDAAPGMLDVARETLRTAGLPPTGLALGDASRLPFAPGSFDCVLCTYTLEVVDEPVALQLLSEMRRVLRPDGRLVVADLTNGEGDDAPMTDEWLRGFEADPEFFGGARPISLRPLLHRAGFEVGERRYSGHGAGWPSEVVLATPSA
jgi:ubiquinone/menaquinone biosynthesis C-methylase UbiE